MASSRKPPSARRVAVALSGGVDSVVLLHLLSRQCEVSAIHVHHGLSPNADAWAEFCRRTCSKLKVPLKVYKVKVKKQGHGLEAAARDARYAAFRKHKAEVIALAHNLDDQAETVLMNLLRGAGLRGASGMPQRARHAGKLFVRPLLERSRQEIEAYASKAGLEWIEDESNADEALTRNFVRRRLGPLIESRFPAWRSSLARAAKHFARRDAHAETLLRKYLKRKGLRPPSEAKLVEMLRQLTAGGARTRIEHDGAVVRVYRGEIHLDSPDAGVFAPVPWRGERRVELPALGGELRFRQGQGIGSEHLKNDFHIKLRSGGERLQLHPRRPQRSLKKLFQEAGVPSWARERLPMLYCGKDLVWVPGLGVDVRFKGRGLVPEWRLRGLRAIPG
jgi:tRNA(Ile)-lysidine synthase